METNKKGEGRILFQQLSYRIVGAAMEVHRELGYGFLEKVYENAMLLLLRQSNNIPSRSTLPER